MLLAVPVEPEEEGFVPPDGDEEEGAGGGSLDMARSSAVEACKSVSRTSTSSFSKLHLPGTAGRSTREGAKRA